MDKTTFKITTSKLQPDNNKKKLIRISTIFRSSCRDRSLSDAVVASSSENKPPLQKPPSPKPPTHPFPSICKPKCPIFSQPKCYNPNSNSTTHHVTKPEPARQKLSESYSLFYSASSAPLSEKQIMNRKKKKWQHRSSRRIVRKNRSVSWVSTDDDYDDDDESDSLLGSRRRKVVGRSRRRMRKKKTANEENKKVAEDEEELQDSYAVVKCSSDPYNDFKTSMVEMILEKKIYKADELERLLQRFLKLNSYRHHPIIIEAFMEIWDALFL